jgi:hypothetical protein
VRREEEEPVRGEESLRGQEPVRREESLRSQESLRREEKIAAAAPEPLPDGACGPPLAAPRIASLPRARLEAMREAGREISDCLRVLRKAGLNVVGEVLRGQGTFYEHNHYPENDVFDAETHAQYYYHAHRGLAGEHGHFHTFLRRAGMPAGSEPLDLPHSEPWPSGDEALAHLIAVSMDAYGMPIGLFAPNRWVCGDTWYAARDLIPMLDRFRIDHAYPSWPVNRWLSAMFVLYRPHIEALLLERDRVIHAWRDALPGEDVLERRELDVLAHMPVSVEETTGAVDAALGMRRRR